MCRRVIAWLGRTGLALVGWRFVVCSALQPKCVVVGAPHTSNWDFPVLMLAGMVLGVRPYWVGKHTLFPWPVAWLMRALGGIPVDRRAASNMVDQLVEKMHASERMFLVMPPEGTRSYTAHWKSGFSHVARKANVPIVMGFIDYPRKQAGLGPVLWPSDDLTADMNQLRAFYADKQGKHPAWQGPVRLRAELDAAPTDDAATKHAPEGRPPNAV